MHDACTLAVSGWPAAASQADAKGEARAARDGDRRAFAALVRRHQRAVYGLCFRLLSSSDEARDAAQEAFVRAWEHLPSFDPGQSFATWVLRIARNLAVDRLRRRGRLLLEEVDGAAPHAQPERALDLARALATLPERWRTAVTLVYLQGHPVRDAAAVLDAPEGTVLSWLHRARHALRRRLS